MREVISLHLSEEALERFRRGAAAAGKSLEEFLSDRLVDAVPPLPDDFPPPLADEMQGIESLPDNELIGVTQQRLADDEQQEYDQLLTAAGEGTLSAAQQSALEAIGEKARLLTLKKAHAWMLLKWRGHELPSPHGLCDAE